MIRDVVKAIEAQLRAHGCPIPVVTGAEPHGPNTGGRERIVIEYDYDASDSFAGPRGHGVNPKFVCSCTDALKATIYAQSGRSGALLSEHETRAKQIRAQLLTALDEGVRGELKLLWSPTGGRFVRPADLEASAKLPGAAYELTFTVESGSPRGLTWKGEANPEVEIGPGFIRSRTDARLENGPDDQPVETGCGGT